MPPFLSLIAARRDGRRSFVSCRPYPHLLALLAVALGTLAAVPAVNGQDGRPRGRVHGRLLDAETREPLIGATVLLEPGGRGAATGLDGTYALDRIPVGAYVLRFSYVGYDPVVRTDVIVRSDRITTVDALLPPTVLEANEVVVSAGYFAETDRQPASLTGFGAEEIRRTPGAAGDVSRMLQGLPSIAKVNDQKNSLVVRGGSPIENGFYVDHIAVPNINHFPTQGSSGGPIGLLNVDFIREVNFHAGGFSAAYGDRLSSVMDIRFREGNREEMDAQFDLHFAGAGFVGEGPLPGRAGSWLLSARRSYLDLLVNTFAGEQADAVPTYSDVHAKAVYDLSPNLQLSLLDILSVDRSGIDRDAAREEHENAFGDADFTANTAGLVARRLWGARGLSHVALSHTVTTYRVNFSETATGNPYFDNQSVEQALRLRNENALRVHDAHHLDFGVEAALERARYDQTYAPGRDPLGTPTPEIDVDDRFTRAQVAAFVSNAWRPIPRLTVTPGLRVAWFSSARRLYAMPRIAVSYQITARTGFHAAAGRYVQALPQVLLAQRPSSRDLRETRARHVIVGMHHLLTPSTRLTVEVYDKTYRAFPLDPAQPSLFVLDQLYYEVQPMSLFLGHERLVDAGTARTWGVETTVQKKLARRLYGLAAASYFRSRYRDYTGTWRDRVFDNRMLVTLEGGFKPNHRHEVSLRWLYAGGAPYTPFDEAASATLRQGVFDTARINAERLPAYHSLNLRYDRRIHFSHATLVVYLSLWNVYGRHNVAGYVWDEVDNRPRPVLQWGTLPIFGLEFEF